MGIGTTMTWRRLVAIGATACAATGCITGVDDDGPPGRIGEAEVRALFIGNSLTAANDLPAMVADIAEAGGHSFDYATTLRPNYSLEDHWATGVEEDIESAAADVVVMQQGPSSVGANPLHLRQWTANVSTAVRASGGRPALLMVWPESTRMEAFDAVRDSYSAAAEAVDGLFIPAGDAWRAVWARDPDAALYGPDGFHPSRLGTFVAALTTYAVLFDEDVRDLPPTLFGDAETAAIVYEAVHETVVARAAGGR